MRILDFCPPKVVNWRAEQGMTLLELVVVMFIAALITGVALPSTLKMIQTNQDHAAQAAILDALNSLSLRAYSQGRGIILTDEAVTSLVPDLPAGWKIEVPKPIDFSLNGFCGKGEIRLISPHSQQQVWVINPPRCQFSPKG